MRLATTIILSAAVLAGSVVGVPREVLYTSAYYEERLKQHRLLEFMADVRLLNSR